MKDSSQRQHIAQFPAATGRYKVVLNSPSIWRGYSTCRLQISVGKPKHEGDKFFALTEWAAARFDKVYLIVSDTLQRHNLALEMGIDLSRAYTVAQIKGHEWLRDNKRAIDNIPVHKRIVTVWDDWVSHHEYAATRLAINSLYARCPIFKAAIADKAQEFCRRQADNGSMIHDDRPEAFETSVRYILEEVAAFGIMLRQQPVVDIYPGPWFKDIFDIIAQQSRLPLLAGFAHAAFLNVDYKTNKATAAGLKSARGLISL